MHFVLPRDRHCQGRRDVTSSAWGFGYEGEFLPSREEIDQGGLADIRSTDDSELWMCLFGTGIDGDAALNELGALYLHLSGLRQLLEHGTLADKT